MSYEISVIKIDEENTPKLKITVTPNLNDSQFNWPCYVNFTNYINNAFESSQFDFKKLFLFDSSESQAAETAFIFSLKDVEKAKISLYQLIKATYVPEKTVIDIFFLAKKIQIAQEQSTANTQPQNVTNDLPYELRIFKKT